MGSTTLFIPIPILLVLCIAVITMGGPSNESGTCDDAEIDKKFLGLAVDFIVGVKREILTDYKTCDEGEIQTTPAIELDMELIRKVKKIVLKKQICEGEKPSDCAEVMLCGRNDSGVYTIWPKIKVAGEKADVFCDMDKDGGGWTVIQRRGDYGQPKDYFYRDWESYKKGFGDIKEDFWLGNDMIFALTNQKNTSLRIDLRNYEGQRRSARYKNFQVESEAALYKLHIGGYSGSAGNLMNTSLSFTTKDRDNDIRFNVNCGVYSKGAWWYSDCGLANLNGLYQAKDSRTSMIWYKWTYLKPMSFTEMKVRPSDFKDFN